MDLTLIESETKEKIIIPQKSCKETEKKTWSVDRLWRVMSHRIEVLDKLFKTNWGGKKWAGLDRVAGYHAYHSLWIAKFRYLAPSVGFTTTQIKQIYTGVLEPCLAAGGYCSIMHRAVVFGPTEIGGLDWDNPIIIHLYEKLKILIGSVRIQDLVGRLMQIQLSWLQVFTSISTPILQYDREITFGNITNHILLYYDYISKFFLIKIMIP